MCAPSSVALYALLEETRLSKLFVLYIAPDTLCLIEEVDPGVPS